MKQVLSSFIENIFKVTTLELESKHQQQAKTGWTCILNQSIFMICVAIYMFSKLIIHSADVSVNPQTLVASRKPANVSTDNSSFRVLLRQRFPLVSFHQCFPSPDWRWTDFPWGSGYKREGQSVKAQDLRGKDLADSAISHSSDRHAATPSCRHSVHTLTPLLSPNTSFIKVMRCSIVRAQIVTCVEHMITAHGKSCIRLIHHESPQMVEGVYIILL